MEDEGGLLPEIVRIQGCDYAATYLGRTKNGRDAYRLDGPWGYVPVAAWEEGGLIMVHMDERDWVLDDLDLVRPQVIGRNGPHQ